MTMPRVYPGMLQHQGAREEQQDALAFSNLEDAEFVAHGGALGIICDGMGGYEGGREAALLAVGSFLESYQNKKRQGPVEVALKDALSVANRSVAEFASKFPPSKAPGCTLVASVILDNRLFWISAGDSRIYLYRNGQLTQLNKDHNLGNELQEKVRQGHMSAEEAAAEPNPEALTSSLGGATVKYIDRNFSAFSLDLRDRVLMCSDGLYNSMSSEEIASVLHLEPQEACEKLVSQAMAKGFPNQDNLTVTMMAYEPDGTYWSDPVSRKQQTQDSSSLLKPLLFVLALIVALGVGYLLGSQDSEEPAAESNLKDQPLEGDDAQDLGKDKKDNAPETIMDKQEKLPEQDEGNPEIDADPDASQAPVEGKPLKDKNGEEKKVKTKENKGKGKSTKKK